MEIEEGRVYRLSVVVDGVIWEVRGSPVHLTALWVDIELAEPLNYIGWNKGDVIGGVGIV